MPNWKARDWSLKRVIRLATRSTKKEKWGIGIKNDPAACDVWPHSWSNVKTPSIFLPGSCATVYGATAACRVRPNHSKNRRIVANNKVAFSPYQSCKSHKNGSIVLLYGPFRRIYGLGRAKLPCPYILRTLNILDLYKLELNRRKPLALRHLTSENDTNLEETSIWKHLVELRIP